jgi:hypothetical protein
MTYKGDANCVEVWRNFVHSYLINCIGMLSCRNLEGQGFFVEPEWNLSTS